MKSCYEEDLGHGEGEEKGKNEKKGRRAEGNIGGSEVKFKGQ